jgi:hypothetical protein
MTLAKSEQHARADDDPGDQHGPMVERLRVEVSRLAQRVSLLERARQPRDDQADDLLRVIARVIGDTPFSAREVLRHARIVEPLRDHLAAAGIRSARQLGKRFRRTEGRDCAGFRLVRLDVDRDGVVWRLLRV